MILLKKKKNWWSDKNRLKHHSAEVLINSDKDKSGENQWKSWFWKFIAWTVELAEFAHLYGPAIVLIIFIDRISKETDDLVDFCLWYKLDENTTS